MHAITLPPRSKDPAQHRSPTPMLVHTHPPTSPLPPGNPLAPAFSFSLPGPEATLSTGSFSVFLGQASTPPAGLPSAAGS